jgi:hypothetical protein
MKPLNIRELRETVLKLFHAPVEVRNASASLVRAPLILSFPFLSFLQVHRGIEMVGAVRPDQPSGRFKRNLDLALQDKMSV